MSDPRTEGHRSSVKTPPEGGFPQVPRAVSRGPETVINPEGRQSTHFAPPDSLPHPASTIVRILFPPAEELPNEERMQAAIGAQLGHFTIVDRIRTGGMGAVFKALDTRLNRIVALKVLPPIPSRDPSAVQRFRKEAQAAAQLNHENIARVYYIGEDQGLHFIAFEFVHGINLRELIQQRGQLSVEDTLNYTLQIASALVHTSSQGVVHRDIKPSNVIITPSGRAKLVDLGLARNEIREDGEPELTVAGTTLGTFDYISPEQAKDPRTADIRSDIYSLGCTLYHLLTAEPPYPQGTMLQKLLQHQGEEAPDPAQKNRRVPEPLSAIVRKMMAKDPRRRYQTAEQLIRDLMLLAGAIGLRSLSPEGLVWMSPQSQRPSFFERHIAWIVSGVALLLFVGFLELANHFSRDPRDSAALVPAVNRPTSSGPETPAVAAGGIPAASPETTGGSSKGSPHVPAPGDDVSPRIASSGGGFGIGPDGPSQGSLEPPAVQGPNESPTGSGPDGQRNPSTAATDAPLPDIRIVGTDVDPRKGFLTLKAACAEVNRAPATATATDGAVIELRFSGKRQEFPFRISRKTIIRAAPGYRPIIEFVPFEVPASGYETRMIQLTGGSLVLNGVEVVFAVPDQIQSGPWYLFSVQRGDSLRLNGCTITLDNARQKPAGICEIQGGTGGVMPEPGMSSGKNGTLEVEFNRTFVRGQADLLSLAGLTSLKLALQDSLVAVDGAVVLNEGNTTVAQIDATADLRIEHSTVAFSRNLIRIDSGEIPRKVLPVHVTAAHSLFTTWTPEPLISMSGRTPASDFKSLLTWNGSDNLYDRLQNFWITNSTEGSNRSEPIDFAGWQKHWGSSGSKGGEANPRSDAVRWDRSWDGKQVTTLTPADFEFTPDGSNGDGPAPAPTGAPLSQLLSPRISKATVDKGSDKPSGDNP